MEVRSVASTSAFGIIGPDGKVWKQTFGTAALAAIYCTEAALTPEQFKSYASHNQRWPAMKKKGYRVVPVTVSAGERTP